MDRQAKILDIAMNLNRIANWAADDFEGKRRRIQLFLEQTTRYLKDLDSKSLPASLQDTFTRFSKDYEELKTAAFTQPKNTNVWAEKMMTWGNILTHRAKLA